MKFRGILVFWKPALVLLSFLGIVIIQIYFSVSENDSKVSRCGLFVACMAILWSTEALPLEVTSFLPVVLLPLLGILKTGEVSKEYFSGANMVFLAAMGVAAAVQSVGLHKRVALRILMATGTGKKSLLFSFMFITTLLSMFICNTATTAMIIPILQVVLDQIYPKTSSQDLGEKSSTECCAVQCTDAQCSSVHCCDQSLPKEKNSQAKEKIMFYLAIGYSANIGGTGTLTASAPNVILKGFLDDMFPCQSDLTYATWLLYALPIIIVIVVLAFFWLMLLFMGKEVDKEEKKTEIKSFLKGKYAELGPVQFQEKMVGFYSFLLVIIWFFEDPEFIKGWAEFFKLENGDSAIGCATPAVFILLLLFITPKHLNFWPIVDKDAPWDVVVLPPALLDWSTVTNFFPWGLLILRGAGFALAKASVVSGLSSWLGDRLSSLESLPNWGILTIVCLITSLVTEVCSNSATANILLPVLADLAVKLKMNPLYLMLPAAVTCCYAFMLPVSCPPNAIVYQASGMDTRHMIMAGVGLNILTLVVNVIAANTYGSTLMGLGQFPDWANVTANCYNCTICTA